MQILHKYTFLHQMPLSQIIFHQPDKVLNSSHLKTVSGTLHQVLLQSFKQLNLTATASQVLLDEELVFCRCHYKGRRYNSKWLFSLKFIYVILLLTWISFYFFLAFGQKTQARHGSNSGNFPGKWREGNNIKELSQLQMWNTHKI